MERKVETAISAGELAGLLAVVLAGEMAENAEDGMVVEVIIAACSCYHSRNNSLNVIFYYSFF